MLLSFLAALLRAIGRQKREEATSAPLNPPHPTPSSLGPEGRTLTDDDAWLWNAEAVPPQEPDYPRYAIDAYMRFGEWLDCSKSTNVQALRYHPKTEELDVIYHGGKGTPQSGWRYGPGIGHELAYEIGTAEALGITPLGNVSTSGKAVKLWDHIRIRGPGNFFKHQVPARRNDSLIAEYQQGKKA